MAQKTGIGCTRQNQSGVLHILFLQCKKLHSLVSQVGSNGYAKTLHYTVPRERAIRQLPVLLIQETLHGNIVRHLVHKQLFYWAL